MIFLVAWCYSHVDTTIKIDVYHNIPSFIRNSLSTKTHLKEKTLTTKNVKLNITLTFFAFFVK